MNISVFVTYFHGCLGENVEGVHDQEKKRLSTCSFTLF